MNLKIVRNWNFMRLLRLVLGLSILIQAMLVKDWTMGIMGLVFTMFPILNIGCCGTSGCATRPVKNNNDTTKEISYEELV